MIANTTRTPPRPTTFRLALLAAAIQLATAGGCGSEQGRADPGRSPERAEQALRSALDAWKAGQTPADVQSSSTPVVVHDSVWKSGRKLSDYQILGRTDGDVRVDFKVRLVFDAKPPKEVDQAYYVWGKTPLSVYRSEDFQKILATDRP